MDDTPCTPISLFNSLPIIKNMSSKVLTAEDILNESDSDSDQSSDPDPPPKKQQPMKTPTKAKE